MIELPAAKALIDPFAQRLTDIHEAAVASWATLLKDFPAFAMPLDATTRWRAIHNHVWSGICRDFDTDPDARPNDKTGVQGVVIAGQIFLRFKYVGHGEPRSYPTTQQTHMTRQHYSDKMFDALVDDPSLGLPTILTCGYTLDGPKLGRVEIRRDCEGHLPWFYDIYGGTTIVMPQSLPGQQDDTKPARVTKRTAAQGEDAADANAAS